MEDVGGVGTLEEKLQKESPNVLLSKAKKEEIKELFHLTSQRARQSYLLSAYYVSCSEKSCCNLGSILKHQIMEVTCYE